MSTDPLVSIIMVTRNRAHLIERSIESVLRQSFGDWEFLIVDNGSDDKTPQIIERYRQKDKRFRPLRNQENEGISRATNQALHEARGKYIAIIDDDDWWLPDDKLERQAAFLEKHPDHVAVGGGLVVVNKEGKELYRYLKPETDEEIRRTMLFANPMAHTTAVYRKEAAKKVGGYNTESPYAGDKAFFMKLGGVGKLYNIPDHLAHYTMGDQNTITVRQREHLRAVVMYTKKYHEGYPRYLPALAFNYVQYWYTFLPLWIRRAINAPLLVIKRLLFDRVKKVGE